PVEKFKLLAHAGRKHGSKLLRALERRRRVIEFAGDLVGIDLHLSDVAGQELCLEITPGNIGAAALAGLEQYKQHDRQPDEKRPAKDASAEFHAGRGCGPAVLASRAIGSFFSHAKSPLKSGAANECRADITS